MIYCQPNMRIRLAIAATLLTGSSVAFAQTAPPPALGQDTKGTPTAQESNPEDGDAKDGAASVTQTDTKDKEAEAEKSKGSPFGTATIKESRRENGQVYLIELEHSSGAKQYIQETDSDGNIQSKSDDLEEAPNLPKWKLGSW